MRLAQRLENRIAARRQTGSYCALDACAYASILFALFFLVMVDAVERRGVTKAVDRVRSTYSTPRPGALREDAIHIAVPRDGAIFFGIYKTRPADLPDKIRNALQNGAEKRVYLSVDARARYGDVALVLAKILLAGVQDVCILTH